MNYKDIMSRLFQDEVITLESKAQVNALYEYMIDHNIDPDRFRRGGLDVWIG